MENKNNQSFSFRKRLLSFKFAFRGIALLFRFEHNAWIHLFVFLMVIAAGFVLQIDKTEWILVLLVSAFVFSAEAFNSSVEALADEVSEEHRERIGKSKDLAAAAVLIAAISAIAIGLIIFLPRVLLFFGVL